MLTEWHDIEGKQVHVQNAQSTEFMHVSCNRPVCTGKMLRESAASKADIKSIAMSPSESQKTLKAAQASCIYTS